jgi:hypothetical protein
MRNALRRIAFAAVIITGLAIATLAATPAHAATTFNICLKNSSIGLCQKSNGTGNQVTISRFFNEWADFHELRQNQCVGTYYCYQFEDANNDCLRAGTSQVVKLESGSCGLSDRSDWWVRVGDYFESWYYYNTGYPFMLTLSDESGLNVWHRSLTPGTWAKWSW